MTVTENTQNHKKETRGFETEVKKMLHLMIHALYSNKEIFLRELVSNASDALDKLRYEGIGKPEIYEGDTELNIKIDYDRNAHTITIKDNGIGMSKDEVTKNLGTIAKSGTQEFLNALSGDQKKDSKLIGQFGVGFYSSFIVADKVSVRTRRAGLSSSEGILWESQGEGDYTIEPIEKFDHGTEITLHIKPGEEEFLSGMRLRHVITKYSDHINFPIIMRAETSEGESESESESKEIKNISEEVVNKATALWTLPKSDITDEDYIELYKHIAHDFRDPLTWAHNKVEGKYEYTTLLYIPSQAPFDLFQANKPRGLKLYVQRVFIMDDAEVFLPSYLRFVRGIIDCNDLPLNVSREILQSNKLVESIRGSIIKRILSTLETIAKEDADKYSNFWKQFGTVIKEGPAEDFANREQIAGLLRFASTLKNQETELTALDDYISRMPEGQEKIYYVAAETFNAAKHSPHLEIFREKNIEVLLLSERIDEWLMSHLTDYKGKHFQSIAKGDLDSLDFANKLEEKSESEKQDFDQKQKDFQGFLERIKTSLGEKVQDVKLSKRLRSSPSCIIADEHQLTSQMERILKAAGQEVHSKPILELNPDHLLVIRLKDETNQAHFDDLSLILLEQAIISEGGQLEDPASFIKRFNEVLLALAKHESN
jgi:molecular chaperone HtpG